MKFVKGDILNSQDGIIGNQVNCQMVMGSGLAKQIRSKYVDWDVNPVDTAVIPNLLQHFTEECTGECPAHETIKSVLNIIEGTFALCMVDTDSNDVYLARQGSVLHYNDNGDFSTLGGEGFKLVPEGTILMLKDYKSWDIVNHFETKSPFLFL
jgi:glucosamine 6-phosphate synthetase-like amidotransferase/phosphosugar isomerase protein